MKITQVVPRPAKLEPLPGARHCNDCATTISGNKLRCFKCVIAETRRQHEASHTENQEPQ